MANGGVVMVVVIVCAGCGVGCVWGGHVWCAVCGVVWCGMVLCGVVWCGVVCHPFVLLRLALCCLTIGPVAQWIGHRPMDPGIEGSSAAGIRIVHGAIDIPIPVDFSIYQHRLLL